MKLVKGLFILLLFTQSVFAKVWVYEEHSTKMYVYIYEPSILSIDTRWTFGNPGGHRISTSLHVGSKVLYAAESPVGVEKNVSAQGIQYFLTPGTYMFRISAVAHGGHAYISNPYMRVTVTS